MNERKIKRVARKYLWFYTKKKTRRQAKRVREQCAKNVHLIRAMPEDPHTASSCTDTHTQTPQRNKLAGNGQWQTNSTGTILLVTQNKGIKENKSFSW